MVESFQEVCFPKVSLTDDKALTFAHRRLPSSMVLFSVDRLIHRLHNHKPNFDPVIARPSPKSAADGSPPTPPEANHVASRYQPEPATSSRSSSELSVHEILSTDSQQSLTPPPTSSDSPIPIEPVRQGSQEALNEPPTELSAALEAWLPRRHLNHRQR